MRIQTNVLNNLTLSTLRATKVRLLVIAVLLSDLQFAGGIIWPSCLVDTKQVSKFHRE